MPFLTVMHRLLREAVSDRRLFLRALVLVVLATCADVSAPLLIKVFIDEHVREGNWAVQPILLLAVAYVALYLVAAMAGYAQAFSFHRIALGAVERLRNRAFSALLRHPIAWFDSHPTGQITSRLTNDTEAIKELYVNALGIFVGSGVRVLGILVAMALLDWRLMLPCLLFLPAVAVVMVVYQRRSAPRMQAVRHWLGEINARLSESIQGMRLIQLFAQQPRFAAEFGEVSSAHYRARVSNLRLDAMLLRPLIDLLYMFTLASLLLFFGARSLEVGGSIGLIYVFISYLGRFVEPVIEMTQRLNVVQQAVVAGARVFELEDLPLAPPRERHLPPGRHALSVRDLSFSYDGQTTVLQGIDLDVPAGHFLALVGHTGSGKSTLASLLMRFYAPASGSIEMGGVPLEEIAREDFHRRVVFVQQDPFIFAGSIGDNIAFGASLSREAIVEASRAAGLHAFVMRMPQGYDTLLGERGVNLSTGQRQLLAMARALARDPEVLILDEATANIDSQSEALIQHSLLALRGRLSLIVIAHRLSTIAEADEIVVLHQGRIAQRGCHAMLVASEGLYRHMYQLQGMG